MKPATSSNKAISKKDSSSTIVLTESPTIEREESKIVETGKKELSLPSRPVSSDQSVNNLKLEITSSRINLAEKPTMNICDILNTQKPILNAQRSPSVNKVNEIVVSNEMNRLLSAASKLNKMPDPSEFFTPANNHQPLIMTMFEDYPQPFTAKSINYVGSANSNYKKAKLNKKTKTNYYGAAKRVSSGSKTSGTKCASSKIKGKKEMNSKSSKQAKIKLKSKLTEADVEDEKALDLIVDDGKENVEENQSDEKESKDQLDVVKVDYETDDFEADEDDEDDDQDEEKESLFSGDEAPGDVEENEERKSLGFVLK